MTLAQIKEVMARVHGRRYGRPVTSKEISECRVTGVQIVNIGESEHYVLSLLWPTWRGDFRVTYMENNPLSTVPIILDITRPRI